eukprot:403337800
MPIRTQKTAMMGKSNQRFFNQQSLPRSILKQMDLKDEQSSGNEAISVKNSINSNVPHRSFTSKIGGLFKKMMSINSNSNNNNAPQHQNSLSPAIQKSVKGILKRATTQGIQSQPINRSISIRRMSSKREGSQNQKSLDTFRSIDTDELNRYKRHLQLKKKDTSQKDYQKSKDIFNVSKYKINEKKKQEDNQLEKSQEKVIQGNKHKRDEGRKILDNAKKSSDLNRKYNSKYDFQLINMDNNKSNNQITKLENTTPLKQFNQVINNEGQQNLMVSSLNNQLNRRNSRGSVRIMPSSSHSQNREFFPSHLALNSNPTVGNDGNSEMQKSNNLMLRKIQTRKNKVKVQYEDESWNDYEDHMRKLKEIKYYEMTIEELRQQIIAEKQQYRQERMLFKQKTLAKSLAELKAKNRCLYCMRCKGNYDLEESSNGSISSDECQENEVRFKKMNSDQKESFIISTWNTAHIKAKAGANILRFFSDLQRNIYLFGISKCIKQIERESRIPNFVLMPYSRFRAIWNIILIIMLLYTALFTPYYIAFIDQTTMFEDSLDYMVDILFGVDVFITLISAYEEIDGSIEHRPERIVKSYVFSWFFIDIAACLPFQQLNLNDGSNYQKLLRLLRLPRLFRMLRIIKILKQIKFLRDSKIFNSIVKRLKMNAAILRMIQGMAGSVLLTHIFACFWFLSAKFDDFDPETWVYRMKMRDQDPSSQYLMSFYWSTQTVITVGYGDVPARTSSEMLISLFWMIFGVGFYSFIIGNYSSIIAGNIQIEATISMKIKSLKDLAKRANLPFDLLIKMKKFIENNFEAIYNQEEEAQLIKILPPSLRDEVLSNTFGEVIDKIEFFKEMDDADFLWKILPLLRAIKLERGDTLYFRGDHAEDSNPYNLNKFILVFFILSGTIKLYTERGYPYIKYSTGALFGDSDTLLNLPRDGKAIAMTHLKLMVLRVDQMFEKLFHNQEKNFMAMIFNARRKRNHHLRLIQVANKKIKQQKKQRRKSVLLQSLRSINEQSEKASNLSEMEEEKDDQGLFGNFKKKILTTLSKKQKQPDSEDMFEKKQQYIKMMRKKAFKNDQKISGHKTPTNKSSMKSRKSILLPFINVAEIGKSSNDATPTSTHKNFNYHQNNNTSHFSGNNGEFQNFTSGVNSRNMQSPGQHNTEVQKKQDSNSSLNAFQNNNSSVGITFKGPNKAIGSFNQSQVNQSNGHTFGLAQSINQSKGGQAMGSLPSQLSQTYYSRQQADLSFISKMDEIRKKEEELKIQNQEDEEIKLPLRDSNFEKDSKYTFSSKSNQSLSINQASSKHGIEKLQIIKQGMHKNLINKQVQMSLRDRFKGQVEVEQLDANSSVKSKDQKLKQDNNNLISFKNQEYHARQDRRQSRSFKRHSIRGLKNYSQYQTGTPKATLAEKLILHTFQKLEIDPKYKDLQIFRDLTKDEVENRDRSMTSRYIGKVQRGKARFKTAQSYKTLFPQTFRSNQSNMLSPQNKDIFSRSPMSAPQNSLKFNNEKKIKRRHSGKIKRLGHYHLSPLFSNQKKYQESLFAQSAKSSKKHGGKSFKAKQSQISSFSSITSEQSEDAKVKKQAIYDQQKVSIKNMVQVEMTPQKIIETFDNPTFAKPKESDKLNTFITETAIDLSKITDKNEDEESDDNQEELKLDSSKVINQKQNSKNVKTNNLHQRFKSQKYQYAGQYTSLKKTDKQLFDFNQNKVFNIKDFTDFQINQNDFNNNSGGMNIKYENSPLQEESGTNSQENKEITQNIFRQNQYNETLHPPLQINGQNALDNLRNNQIKSHMTIWNTNASTQNQIQVRKRNHSSLFNPQQKRRTGSVRIVAERPSHKIMSQIQSPAHSQIGSQSSQYMRYISPFSLQRLYSNNQPQVKVSKLELNSGNQQSREQIQPSRTMMSNFYRAQTPSGMQRSPSQSISEAVSFVVQQNLRNKGNQNQIQTYSQLRSQTQNQNVLDPSRLQIYAQSQNISPRGMPSTGGLQSRQSFTDAVTSQNNKQLTNNEIPNGYINFDMSLNEHDLEQQVSIIDKDEGFIDQSYQLLDEEILGNQKSYPNMSFIENETPLDNISRQQISQNTNQMGYNYDQNLDVSNIRSVVVEEIKRKFSHNFNIEYLRMKSQDIVAGVPKSINSPINRQPSKQASLGAEEGGLTLEQMEVLFNKSQNELFLNDQQLEYYGDPSMMSLVQFNADMGHIAMNVFETYSVFEIINSSLLQQRKSLQEIHSQNTVIQQRQDNMDRKLDEIEQQLTSLQQMGKQQSMWTTPNLSMIQQDISF